MSVWVIIVAAGSGSRFGGAKQFERLGDRRIIDWSLEAARAVADGVVVVVAPEGEVPDIDADRVVTGGETRSASVRAGLRAVPDDADIILVHDAARPLAGSELFRSVVAAVAGDAAAAVPAVPVVDTIKSVDGPLAPDSMSYVTETVDRSRFVAVQTPQGFRADVLRSAHASGAEATDDATLVENAGEKVAVILGHEANRKVTVRRDLDVLNAVIAV